MSFKTKSPSSKLILAKGLFNRLLCVLDYNESLNIEDENFSKIATKLKEKILTYSKIINFNNDSDDYVEIRFFPSDMIWQLLMKLDTINAEKDYFEVLKSRKK